MRGNCKCSNAFKRSHSRLFMLLLEAGLTEKIRQNLPMELEQLSVAVNEHPPWRLPRYPPDL
jgi:hypothetical protein